MSAAMRETRVWIVGVFVALLCAVFIAIVPQTAQAAAFLPDVEFDDQHHTSYDVTLVAASEGIDDKIQEALDAGAAKPVNDDECVLEFPTFDGIFDYFALADIALIESNQEWYHDGWCLVFGHDFKTTHVEPDCTTYGYDLQVCKRCGHVRFAPKSPLGHDWSVTWTWTDDPVGATAKFSCGRDESHAKEVAADISTVTMEDGTIKYVASAVVDGVTYTDNRIPPAPGPHQHDWNDPLWTWHKDEPVTAKATFQCKTDESHKQELEADVASSTAEDGTITYIATVTFEGTSYTDQYVVKPIGPQPHQHEWSEPEWSWTDEAPYSAQATFTCKGDASHTQTVDADVADEKTADGKTKYTATVTFNDKTFTDERIVEPTLPGPHQHEWSEPTWSWTDEAPYSAQATFTCKGDASHTQTVDADVADEKTADGKTKYTATVTFNGKTFTDERILAVVDSPNPDDDTPTVDLIIGSDPVVAPVGADGKVDINVEGAGSFTISIDGAPQGNVSFAVRQVTAGPVYEALSNAVTEVASGHEVAGVYDIDLTVNGRQMADNFGTLTLEFPVNSNHNNRWATVFHCHNNDTDNISSYDSVLARNGKVTIKGVKNLSTFAVAVGDRAVLKQISQVNTKTRITRGVVQPLSVDVKRPVMVSESETLMRSVAGPSADAAAEEALPEAGIGSTTASGQGSQNAQQTAVIGVGIAIAALMTLLVALIIYAQRRKEM